MKISKIYFFLLTSLLSLHVHGDGPASAEDDVKWQGNISMNGYKLSDYKDFATKWKLVTVRYRIDSGEFRFVYANPIAWKALQSKASSFPDGATFAKTAYLLSHDPKFTSSLVPSEVARYQLMVKNSKKHQDSGGWGYALFDKEGKTFAGNPIFVTKSCVGCHTVARSMDYIFSYPAGIKPALFSNQANVDSLEFETQNVSELPQILVKFFPKGVSSFRLIKSPIRDHIFQGTLEEIKPFLAMEAIKAKLPAVLMSRDKKRFSAVFGDEASQNGCQVATEKGAEMIYAMSVPKDEGKDAIPTYVPLHFNEEGVLTQSFCFSLN